MSELINILSELAENINHITNIFNNNKDGKAYEELRENSIIIAEIDIKKIMRRERRQVLDEVENRLKAISYAWSGEERINTKIAIEEIQSMKEEM